MERSPIPNLCTWNGAGSGFKCCHRRARSRRDGRNPPPGTGALASLEMAGAARRGQVWGQGTWPTPLRRNTADRSPRAVQNQSTCMLGRGRGATKIVVDRARKTAEEKGPFLITLHKAQIVQSISIGELRKRKSVTGQQPRTFGRNLLMGTAQHPEGPARVGWRGHPACVVKSPLSLLNRAGPLGATAVPVHRPGTFHWP